MVQFCWFTVRIETDNENNKLNLKTVIDQDHSNLANH